MEYTSPEIYLTLVAFAVLVVVGVVVVVDVVSTVLFLFDTNDIHTINGKKIFINL